MTFMRFFLFLTFFLTSLSLHAAGDHDHDHDHHSHGGEGLAFEGHVHMRNHFDGVTAAPEPSEKIKDFYIHSHADLHISLYKGLALNMRITLDGEPQGHEHGLEPHDDDDEHHDDDEDEDHHDDEDDHDHEDEVGRNSYYQDHPLFTDELNLSYHYQNFAIRLGQFLPRVGFRPDRFPGIWGYQPIHEYEIRDRVGISGHAFYNAPNFGRHSIDAATFFANTTFFSDSFFSRRGHRSLRDGGVANTETLDSFSVSIAGRDVVPNLEYRIGYSKQARAKNPVIEDASSETRFSLSAKYRYRFASRLYGNMTVEYMDIDDFLGLEGNQRNQSTVAFALQSGNWQHVVQYSHAALAGSDTEGIFQISSGYRVSKSVILHLGYQQSRGEGEVIKRIGGMLEYELDFSIE